MGYESIEQIVWCRSCICGFLNLNRDISPENLLCEMKIRGSSDNVVKLGERVCDVVRTAGRCVNDLDSDAKMPDIPVILNTTL